MDTLTLEKTTGFTVVSPLDGTTLASLKEDTQKDLNQAVQIASKAQKVWAVTPIKERTAVLFNYRNLLELHKKQLTILVHKENGKTMSEAQAEINKSIELTEFACSMPQLIAGDTLEVSTGVDCKTIYIPMGVVACITPFNFPNMVPNWTLPNALVLGNAIILKPSELVPLSAIRILELFEEAGLPQGLLQILNGGKKIVEHICDHPEIKAVSFVGSTPVAKIVYARAAASHKKALCLGGAKNHLIVLPDADIEMSANNIIASMSGCAGQRCMAASVMIAVGNCNEIIDKMVVEAKAITSGKTLGSVITPSAKAKIESYIDSAEREGAKILVDGRGAKVEDKEGGNYVGATIIDNVNPKMKVATDEIFGPVIAIIRVNTIEEALEIENDSLFGNAASVFTQNGGHAKYISENVNAGMVGINVGVPVPREPFSFAGWSDSKFGSGDLTGKSSIEFWTQLKKVTTKWNAAGRSNWMS